jgi:threonine dehydratase
MNPVAVREAAERLRGVAHRTPVVTSRTLDERAGARVFCKCENLQRVGAFKFRGAYNRIAMLGEHERKRGVVAYSSGNHAQGVALAARLHGVRATVVMPDDAPSGKRDAVLGYGAEIVSYDRRTESRERIAERLARERAAVLVPPFDDPAIIAGQGTAALELFEDCGPLDALVVPVGGGGLAAGSCLAAAALAPDCAVWGVEPEGCDDFRRSLECGERKVVAEPHSIADGLLTPMPGALTFEIVREHHMRVVTVSDDEMKDAMRFAFERMKLVLEPSGAAGLAALLARRIPLSGKRVGVIFSGGNVDAARFAALCGS